MPAPDRIRQLVETFAANLDDYKSGSFNEAQVRQQFVNPFFKCLGWDMDNEQGLAEAYKDVIHEDSLRIGEATKAPDYCFRIGKERKFFVEAKKPSVHVKEDPGPAYQLRRYAWNAKLPLSIVTDFEEFAVYDCRIKPNPNDKASLARTDYYTFRDYLDKWDEIAGKFSKEAVLKGSFDKYAEQGKGKRGTATVDTAFLRDIESWRELLAKDIAKNNPKIDGRELNFAVQATLDRIIFLRMCEDRGIEDYGRLLGLTNAEKIYDRLKQFFRAADDRYNSGLFYFTKEKDRSEPPDELTPRLKIGDKPLKEILTSLYFPRSPYQFDALPVEILGQVYEQFLGKVIRLTAGHQCRIEDKPEVKKAGGVYYTPKYIVDYIVEHTVGRLLNGDCREGEAPAEPRAADAPQRHTDSAGASPSQPPLSPSPLAGEGRGGGASASTPHPNPPPQGGREPERKKPGALTPKQAAKLRILDPACGSGSFLLGAYQYLLDWHRDWYVADGPAQHTKELYQSKTGDWRLTTAEKKRILLNNIYGVDIDPQAVEVTKLSLLLKVLEGETQESLESQRRIWHERALPDLASNIKCGNSLIGPDFYDGQTRGMFDEEEQLRVNVFDWHAGFSAIMKTGGFDAVIGNPPYVRIHRIRHEEADYLFGHYKSPTSKADLSLLFLEQGLRLTNPSGVSSFICTSQWLATDYGRNLRAMLKDGNLIEIVDFGSLPVFERASTYPAIFVLSSQPANNLRYKRIATPDQLKLDEIEHAAESRIRISELSSDPWALGRFNLWKALDRKLLHWRPLYAFGRAFIGTKSGMADVFVMTTAAAKELRLESELLYPYAYQGAEVDRYTDVRPDSVIIYPYSEGSGGAPVLIPEDQLRRRYPRVYKHLLRSKDVLRTRQDSRKLYAKGAKWYRHLRPGSFRYIHAEKLAAKGIAKRVSVGLLAKENAFDGANCPAIIMEDRLGHDLKYFLGVLNSTVSAYFLRSICPPKLSGYTRFSASCISQVPIAVIDFADRENKSRHDRLVALVDQMLALHKQLAKAKSSPARSSLEHQIAATDRQIDRLVYDLYGLTEEEIRIVEEGTA